MKNIHFTTLLILLISFHQILVAQVPAPDRDSYDPARIAFGGVGMVGGSFNSGGAIYINPARIAQEAKLFGKIGYIPWDSIYSSQSQNQVFNVDLGYHLGKGHRIAFSHRNTREYVNGEKVDKGDLFTGAYSFTTKKSFSFGLSIRLENKLFLYTVREPSHARYHSFAINIGVAKRYTLAENQHGHWKLDWGASLTEFGETKQINSTPNFTYFTNPNLNLGIGLEKRIRFPNTDLHLDVNLGLQAQKPLQPDFIFPRLQKETIIGQAISSLTDNPDGFVGELGEFTHNAGFRLAAHKGQFMAAAYAGRRSDYRFASPHFINSWGFELGHHRLNAQVALLERFLKGRLPQRKPENKWYTFVPFYALSYQIPLSNK